jgi:hypothetical protein
LINPFRKERIKKQDGKKTIDLSQGANISQNEIGENGETTEDYDDNDRTFGSNS